MDLRSQAALSAPQRLLPRPPSFSALTAFHGVELPAQFPNKSLPFPGVINNVDLESF
jgi:hypothetical protein